jgi:hypothetical protein
MPYVGQVGNLRPSGTRPADQYANADQAEWRRALWARHALVRASHFPSRPETNQSYKHAPRILSPKKSCYRL